MIALLVLVNLFLAAMLLGRMELTVYDSKAVSNIIELLQESGITADKKFFNTRNEGGRVYACDIGSDYTTNVARILMGEYEEVFATPVGAEFFGKSSHMSISENFKIVYSANGFEPTEATDKPTEIEIDALTKNLKAILGDNAKLIDCGKRDSFLYAEAVQTLGDLEVSNHTVKCWFEGDKPVYLEGMWSFLSIDESFSAHTLDSVNILFIEKNELDEARDRGEQLPDMLTLKSMTECYCSHLSANGTKLYFMPSWHIEWKEDGVKDSFYNAVNGEKTFSED